MFGRSLLLAVFLSAVLLATASAAPAAARPKLKVSVKPAVAAPGAAVTVSGRVTGRVPKAKALRILLEERVGKRWLRRVAVKPARKAAFAARWRVPSSEGIRTLRLRLVRGRKVMATSAAWRLKVVASPRPAPASPGPAAPVSPSSSPSPTPTDTATPDEGTPPAPDPDAQPAQTQVIAPSAVESAPSPAAGGTLRLVGTVPVRPGDVLASGIGSAAPYGFLFKATEVEAGGGDTLIEVEPATLIEAVPNGSIDRHFAFAPASGTNKRAADRRPAIRFRETLDCSAGGTVTVEGSADLGGPQLDLDADWGILSLNSLEATASVTASAHASATATGAASCTVGPLEIFETKLAPITFTVGAVPVVLVPEIEVTLEGLGEIGAAVSTSVDASLTARAGARYDDDGVAPISELKESFTHQAPAPEGSAKLTATLSSELEVAAYGVGGPTFAFNAGLAANADPGAPHPWWTLDAPISFTAGFDLDILELQVEPITVYSHSFRLAEAAPESYAWTGSVTLSETLRSAGLIYAAPDGNHVTDTVTGGFSAMLADAVGPQIAFTPSSASVSLVPSLYPGPFLEIDPDCTWSRSWDEIAFTDEQLGLEITPVTENQETGQLDRAKGSVSLYSIDGQVDDRGYSFGYDYTETSGDDATCDFGPSKGSERRFWTARIPWHHFGGLPARGITVTRDAEGRLKMQGTVTHELPLDARASSEFPVMANGYGTRTITVDLTGVPPGLEPTG